MGFVRRNRWAVLLVLLIWPAVAKVQDGDRPAAEGPREVGLTEQTMRRLAQLDVTVTGPDEIIRELSRDDFELVIANEIVPDFFVDRICGEPEAAETAAGSERPSPTAPEPEEDAEAQRPLSIRRFGSWRRRRQRYCRQGCRLRASRR